MTDTNAIIREVRDCVACWLENATEDHATPEVVRRWTMSAEDFDSMADALGDGASPDSVALALRTFG